MINKINKNTFILIIVILIITFFAIWNDKEKDPAIIWNLKNLEEKPSMSQTWNIEVWDTDTWNYYDSEKTTDSVAIEDLEEKLKQEWKIEGITFKFDKDWFKYSWEDDRKFKINSNIRIEIDAWNTWLSENTELKISIPWADFESLIKRLTVDLWVWQG